ncbi:AbrB/MazE/SpoVT family DNA-binding domain-containing protein [Candidatus Oleimmundimicrobium sp.]|uniref:AbrB/MazE/SpoVT family DNA-binding domain-containing protein n=1 Tax=Candidatus Oleimmundimicrobium sp. TaxID=3060597 RepID=UPI00272874A7|nr:AbrB/MazE/SpoVT family DNA-binding domain-containing protein [Candidatus Oleimmundimicrobium sp.]MDO8885867.1 AbrB/MazE/SpoVT family DNA-binding domain-containing protein [Candidatus Oleimmundimicrobium sp.]
MKTTLTKRGQIAVPAEIRKKFRLQPGSKLYWLNTGKEIKLVPVSADPIEAMYGSASGKKLTEKLLKERRKDKEREKR